METLSIIKNVTSNKVSELLIDGVKYEVTVLAGSIGATVQTVVVRKID